MSRADEERAKYSSKIAQIRNNLLAEAGASGVTQSNMVNEVFTRISKVIDESSHACSEDESDCESSQESIKMSPTKYIEESKEMVNDLSLSLINKQIGAVS